MFRTNTSIARHKSRLIKSGSGVITLVAVALLASSIPAQAEPTVGLGLTTPFAVLAGSGISNTGPTTVSGTAGGDLGSAHLPALL